MFFGAPQARIVAVFPPAAKFVVAKVNKVCYYVLAGDVTTSLPGLRCPLREHRSLVNYRTFKQ
nr:MAG TPA_asm: hypothetical protein [Caudoviricetes sp.]